MTKRHNREHRQDLDLFGRGFVLGCGGLDSQRRGKTHSPEVRCLSGFVWGRGQVGPRLRHHVRMSVQGSLPDLNSYVNPHGFPGL